MIYEAHITCRVKDAVQAQRVADLLGWKTSEIARDIALGNDTYFYLTTHERNYFKMGDKLKVAVGELRARDVEVVREKIEAILYDTKLEHT